MDSFCYGWRWLHRLNFIRHALESNRDYSVVQLRQADICRKPSQLEKYRGGSAIPVVKGDICDGGAVEAAIEAATRLFILRRSLMWIAALRANACH